MKRRCHKVVREVLSLMPCRKGELLLRRYGTRPAKLWNTCDNPDYMAWLIEEVLAYRAMPISVRAKLIHACLEVSGICLAHNCDRKIKAKPSRADVMRYAKEWRKQQTWKRQPAFWMLGDKLFFSQALDGYHKTAGGLLVTVWMPDSVRDEACRLIHKHVPYNLIRQAILSKRL